LQVVRNLVDYSSSGELESSREEDGANVDGARGAKKLVQSPDHRRFSSDSDDYFMRMWRPQRRGLSESSDEPSLIRKTRKIYEKNDAEDERTHDDEAMDDINQLWGDTVDNRTMTTDKQVSTHILLGRISFKWWV